MRWRPRLADVPADEAVQNARGRWVEAGDLEPGDVLLTRTGNQTVRAVTREQESGPVYYLTVAEYNNHGVGVSGMLVHNGDGEKESAGPPEFIADHPFLFYILHEPTGIILFMGKVENPG